MGKIPWRREWLPTQVCLPREFHGQRSLAYIYICTCVCVCLYKIRKIIWKTQTVWPTIYILYICGCVCMCIYMSYHIFFNSSIDGDLTIWSKWTSLVAQMVKRLPTMWDTWVQTLGWEDLLEKEMAPHSSILAWKIPWTEEPGSLQSMGSQRVRHDWATSLSFTTIWSTLKCWDLHKEWLIWTFFLFPEAFYLKK